jgi:hypothetical protein
MLAPPQRRAVLPQCHLAAVLQALVDGFDKRYVNVVGFMMHLNGYPQEQKSTLSQQFLQVSMVPSDGAKQC